MTREEAKKRLEVWLICGECPEDKQCYDSYLHSTVNTQIIVMVQTVVILNLKMFLHGKLCPNPIRKVVSE